MSSIFRKVASAFVVMDPSDGIESSAAGQPSTPSTDASALGDLSDDAGALLAELEGRASPGRRTSVPPPPPRPAGGSVNVASIFDAGAAEVFRAANLGDDANSASRLLKIIAGLQMFPSEHQVMMIQAMDAADDTWSQAEVMADARRRNELLTKHLEDLASRRKDELAVLQATISARTKQGNDALAEIDRKITELHAERERNAAATTSELNLLQQEVRSVETREAQARAGIEEVMARLASLAALLEPKQGRSTGTPR